MQKLYNDCGRLLLETEIYQKADERFFSNNEPLYEVWLENADKHGFDKTKVGPDGKYVRPVVLPKGKKIIRYGLNVGRYTSDIGANYESLSLPYIKDSMPYHEYIVAEDCEVLCIVDKGFVAPGFKLPGGGIQYYHYEYINRLLVQGVLKEDMSWIKK